MTNAAGQDPHASRAGQQPSPSVPAQAPSQPAPNGDQEPKKKLPKWAWAVLIIAILGAFGAIIDDDEAGQGVGAESAEEAKDDASADSEKQAQAQAPLAEDERVEQLVRKVLDGENNRSQDYLAELDIEEQIDGGWGVFVEFNADDNLTANLRKTGIEKTMSEIYIKLYTSEHDVRTASVTALFPLVDQYGNEKDGMVYKSLLDKKEANKVNYDADPAYLKLTILPGVWTRSWLHPEFQE